MNAGKVAAASVRQGRGKGWGKGTADAITIRFRRSLTVFQPGLAAADALRCCFARRRLWRERFAQAMA
jgi:hypothetical protein